MADLEKVDVMLGIYSEKNYDMQGKNDENEINSRSNKQDHGLVNNDEEFRSCLNTNLVKRVVWP